jgi:hypothetical protein
VPQGKHLRATPYMPYLSFAPGAWVLPLKFAGGGYAGGAKVMFDSEGNAWSGANFIVGGQGMVVFYGLAKPVRAPQIGPARQP